jgi:hypothetical protein
MRFPARMLPALVACAVLAPSGTAHADQFLGVTPDDRLVHFTAKDRTLGAPVKLTGLGGLGHVVAIDARSTTGGLYGMAQDGKTVRLVRIDQASGAVTPIGAPVDLDWPPIGLGLDFNPLNDTIAFVADSDRNLTFDPDTGSLTLKPPPSPTTPTFIDVAWTPVSGGITVPYALDSEYDRIVLGDGSGPFLTDPNDLDPVIAGRATIDFAPNGLLWLLVYNHLYRVDSYSGIGVGAGPIAEPLSAMAVQLTGDIGFGAGAFGATESDGVAAVTLRRAAPTAGAAKVKWTTAGGTATAGADYAASHGQVTFAPGQSTATVKVPLANDGAAEGPERIGLHLTSVDGVPAGPDAAVVLADDDAPAPAPGGGGGGTNDTTAPVLLALPAKLAAKRSLKLPFALSEAGVVTVTLKLKSALAKKLKLSAELATATLQGAPGDNTAVLKLSKKEARKLHARRSTKATADIVATDASGNRATRTMKVTLT